MLNAIICAIAGFFLMMLCGIGLHSLGHMPAHRIPLLFTGMMGGIVLLAYGGLGLWYGTYPRRRQMPLRETAIPLIHRLPFPPV